MKGCQSTKKKQRRLTKIAAGEAVQVNNENGYHLTKMAADETVEVALQRLLVRFGKGALLEDKNGMASPFLTRKSSLPKERLMFSFDWNRSKGKNSRRIHRHASVH